MPIWSKTSIPNVVRHETGGYYLRMRIGGSKRVMRSLETDKAAIAALRAPVKMLEVRGEKKMAVNSKTLGALADVYLIRKKLQGLKPRALDYRTETVEMLRRTWTDFDATEAAAVTLDQCKDWADAQRAEFSASRFNGMVESLRGILAIAVDSEACEKNHALKIDRAEVKRNSRPLPTDAKFKKLLARLKNLPSRKPAFDFVRLLAYSGQRPSSVRMLTVASVNLKTNLVRWPPIKHNDRFNEQPMGKDLRKVIEEIVKSISSTSNEASKLDMPLIAIQDPKKALAHASKEAGIDPPLTASDFRHFFTTRALEAGIPVPIVAAMRGDKDGGAMLLKNYVHPRLEHLRKMAAKL